MAAITGLADQRRARVMVNVVRAHCPENDLNQPEMRLAAIYDSVHRGRGDLAPYVDIVTEFSARKILDIGCGTGTFALMLASRGYDVIGLEPNSAWLEWARSKPGADKVRWVVGDVGALTDDVCVDLVAMTANTAQAIVDPQGWEATLDRARIALNPQGNLVFETRVPTARAWDNWTREHTFATFDVAALGLVARWCEVVEVELPLVTFRWITQFLPDRTEVAVESTIRFRDRAEVANDLATHGFLVHEVREAPDRFGREWVFLARPR